MGLNNESARKGKIGEEDGSDAVAELPRGAGSGAQIIVDTGQAPEEVGTKGEKAVADNNPSGLSQELASYQAEAAATATTALTKLIRSDDLVGDLLKIDYSECEVLVHDHLRQKVGGLPLGCFLVATRLSPGSSPEPTGEDASLILLRVVGQYRLPNASETDLNRFMAGQRVATLDEVWDAEGKTDQFTLHQLRYAGVSCRVLGTFRMREVKPTKWQR